MHQGREEMVVVPRLRSRTNCVAANYDRATDSASVVQARHKGNRQTHRVAAPIVSGLLKITSQICLNLMFQLSDLRIKQFGGNFRL
jgi:hypothetical protein